MTKKDHIVTAEILISNIQLGHTKKNGIKNSITVASNFLMRDNYKFDAKKFREYIMERI